VPLRNYTLTHNACHFSNAYVRGKSRCLGEMNKFLFFLMCSWQSFYLFSLRTTSLEWSATDLVLIIQHTWTVPEQTKDHTIYLAYGTWLGAFVTVLAVRIVPYKRSNLLTYLLTYFRRWGTLWRQLVVAHSWRLVIRNCWPIKGHISYSLRHWSIRSSVVHPMVITWNKAKYTQG